MRIFRKVHVHISPDYFIGSLIIFCLHVSAAWSLALCSPVRQHCYCTQLLLISISSVTCSEIVSPHQESSHAAVTF